MDHYDFAKQHTTPKLLCAAMLIYIIFSDSVTEIIVYL